MDDRLLSVSDHAGDDYLIVLARLHELLKPASYLEIGISRGESLKLAQCDTLAIDPSFDIHGEAMANKRVCLLFRMGSDCFFSKYNPQVLLRGPVDLAFIDGLHLSEFLLRDFINTERHCRRNSVILLHDCLPTDAYIAERVDDRQRRERLSTRPGWWAGDVWKIIPILKKYRPDVALHAFDAPPTGLVAVTNLDPVSNILSDRYFQIVDEFQRVELVNYGIPRLFEEVRVKSTAEIATFEQMSQFFWL